MVNSDSIFNNKRLFTLILFSTILLYFIFAPAVNSLFYSGDDLRYAFGGYGKSCGGDDGFYFMITLGRPLQAYIDCLSYRFAYTFEHMRFIRLISVVLLGCSMGLLAEWLCTLGFTVVSAFFTASVIILIQKLYYPAIFVGATPLPLAVLLVILAYKCLGQSHALRDGAPLETAQSARLLGAIGRPPQGERFKFLITGKRFKEIMWLGLASWLLMFALLCYPAMTFFFGSLPLIKVLFSNLENWNKTRREVIREVLLFCGVCVIYFIWAYYNMHYHPRTLVPKQYQISNPNVFLMEVFNRLAPVVNVFTGPWALFPMSTKFLQGSIILTAIIAGTVGGLRTFYLQHGKSTFNALAQASVFVIVLLGLCSGFYLIIPQPESMDSQILFATAESGVVLLIWGIYRFSEMFSKKIKNAMILVLILAIFVGKGYQTSIWMVAHSIGHVHYVDFIKKQIVDFEAKGNKLRRVHYVLSPSEFPYDKFFLTNAALMGLYDRGSYKIKWCSLPRGNRSAEEDHQDDMINCVNSLPANGIAVTYTHPGETFKATDNMLLIEMENINKDYFIRQNLKSLFNV